MFSQWRHTIENLASTAHSPKLSQDAAAEGSSLDGALRQSLSSSTQLADTAITNLRKTLTTQRAGSPVSKSSPTDSSSSTARSRSTLEDRLRAKFAIGEASEKISPNPSTWSTPSRTPTPVIDHSSSSSSSASATEASLAPERSLSPTSIPLPDSPRTSIEMPRPISGALDHPLSPEPSMNNSPSSVIEAAPDQADLPAASIAEEVLDNTAEEMKQEESADALHEESSIVVPSASPPVDEVAVTSSPPSDSLMAIGREEQDNGIPADMYKPSEDTSVPEIQPPEVTNPDDRPREPSLPTTVSVETGLAVESEALALLLQEPEPAASTRPGEPDIEGLRERLKLVEQRFADVSISFKQLQTEKVAADRVLQELTPLESMQETDALREFLQNINLKTEMAQDEIKRLNGKLTRQEERIEELRDTHRLESKSQSEQIHRLRGQSDEAEALLKAAQGSVANLEAQAIRREADVTCLQGEMEKLKVAAKDEEEKRVKAIGLLKTVRQKLVKAEKERDDALHEAKTLQIKETETREKERAERERLQSEVEKANTEKDIAIQGIKARFDKETAALKDRQEKELSALRGQYELETITLKSAHAHELSSNDARIAELESAVKALDSEKAELFDQLQMRQAELESSQSTLESLQSQHIETQYQLREATDLIALLNDELAESRRDQATKINGRGSSTEEVTRLLSAAEAKYENKIADLRRQLAAVERERDDGEAEFSKKLAEKAKEIEHFRLVMDASAKDHQGERDVVNGLREEIVALQEQTKGYHQVIDRLRAEAGKVSEVQNTVQTKIDEANARIAVLQHQIEEHRIREAQVRAHNKTLREELRRVQSSAALLEKQRNPGVGYWANKPDTPSEARSPTSSASDLARDSPRPASPSAALSDEEVNFEYLRNVILQFLEHKEMRPHLVRILSTILRFTPQETRRLVAKV